MKPETERKAAEAQGLGVTFLGTGSAFSRRFGQTNAMIETGSGSGLVVVDCGPQAPARLEALGCELRSIRHILISHLHADHTGGLEELAFRCYFQWRTRPVLALPEALVDPLWERSLKGGLELISDAEGGPKACTLESYFEILPLRTGAWTELGDVAVWPFEVDHVPGKIAFGFAVEERGGAGRRLIFACDTRRQIPELLRDPLPRPFGRGPIFHDCQLFDLGPSGIHTTLDEILDYPESIRQRIVVNHYGDDIEGSLDRIRDGGLRVAWPGVRVAAADWRQAFGCQPPADLAVPLAG